MGTRTPLFGTPAISGGGNGDGDDHGDRLGRVYDKLVEVAGDVREMKSDLAHHCENQEQRDKKLDQRIGAVEDSQKVLTGWRARTIWTSALLAGGAAVVTFAILLLKHFKL